MSVTTDRSMPIARSLDGDRGEATLVGQLPVSWNRRLFARDLARVLRGRRTSRTRRATQTFIDRPPRLPRPPGRAFAWAAPIQARLSRDSPRALPRLAAAQHLSYVLHRDLPKAHATSRQPSRGCLAVCFAFGPRCSGQPSLSSRGGPMTLAIDLPHDPGDPASDHPRPWPHDPGDSVAPSPWRKRRPLAPSAWRPTLPT
jgi:hypothetical protein